MYTGIVRVFRDCIATPVQNVSALSAEVVKKATTAAILGGIVVIAPSSHADGVLKLSAGLNGLVCTGVGRDAFLEGRGFDGSDRGGKSRGDEREDGDELHF